MNKTNAQWHAANRMPKQPTEAERIAWHKRHVEHCQCRPIPESVRRLMAKSVNPGYSGKPLADKLGLKPGLRVRWIGAPRDLTQLLSKDIHVQRSINESTDLVHLFVKSQVALKKHLASLRAKLRPDAAVWVSWPKKSAQVATDVTEDTIRAVALPLGWVDIKVCAVDETWSGLKLVVRKELR